MNPLLAQLEAALRLLVAEHRGLLGLLDAHEAALRSFRADAIERAARDQDAARQRIAAAEARRRSAALQIARGLRQTAPPTIARLAELYPDKRPVLLALRQELRDLAERVRARAAFVGKVTQGVLGHLNATVRLIAQAANGPGTYTKSGGAPLPSRVGVLNAVA